MNSQTFSQINSFKPSILVVNLFTMFLNGSSTLKEACAQRGMRKSEANYVTYIDSMQSAINKNMMENVLPNWRNH